MKTTVVIPNLNGIEYIDECLASIERSSRKAKIIVVDNGSKDGSVELIKKSHPEVKLIELNENTGFCHAMNIGFAKADTEYVFALNNDTKIDENAIGYLENVLDGVPSAFSVQAKMLKMSDPSVIDSTGDEYCALGWAFASNKDKKDEHKTGVYNIFSSCGGAAMYRRSMLKEIGGYDEAHFAYLEDVDLGYRALLNGFKNLICLDAVVYHAGSATTGSRYNAFKARYSARNSIYLIYKNMPAGQIILNLPLLMAGYFVKLLFFARKGFGTTYFNGILRGLDMCMSEDARAHKIYFKKKNIFLYLKTESLLLVNVIRRFVL